MREGYSKPMKTKTIEQIIDDALKSAPDPEYKYAYALGVVKGIAEMLEENIAVLEQKIAAKQKEIDDANREIARSRDMEAV